MQYTRLEQDIIDNMERGLSELEGSLKNMQKIKIEFFKKGVSFRHRQIEAQEISSMFAI